MEITKDKILPYIKLKLPLNSDDKTIELNADNSPILKDLMSDLIISYAINNEDHLELIKESDIKKLNISKEELHKIALTNLDNLVGEKLKPHGDTNYLMLTLDGNFEASLLLLDYIWTQLLEQFKDDLVVSVPSRDVLLITGLQNKQSIDLIKERSKDIHGDGDHILSKRLFKFSKKGWEKFELNE